MAIKRPKRKRYPSDVEWHLACLRYLDAKYPGREGQRKRVVAFARWTTEQDADLLRARIRELMLLDRPLTDDEDADLLDLIAQWHRTRYIRITDSGKARS